MTERSPREPASELMYDIMMKGELTGVDAGRHSFRNLVVHEGPFSGEG